MYYCLNCNKKFKDFYQKVTMKVVGYLWWKKEVTIISKKCCPFCCERNYCASGYEMLFKEGRR